ncbi:MAG: patatin-like phospholipase family protein [Treponema sp.]|nr:patatin-like phospholipase family protein [Treponema sp.]
MKKILKIQGKKKQKKKAGWALVLSGGGARGFAHIGLLKALEKAGFPKPSLIVGTSMGAIVGGLYACGMSPAELENFVINEFNVTDHLDSFVFKINGPFGRVIQTGQALANLAGKPGIDGGQSALKLLEELTGKKRFNETEIPFRCNAVDLISGQEIVFSSGSVAKAMRASMSLPLFFEPFKDKGMYLIDGGLIDNIPVAIARKEGYEKVIAVNVNSFATSKYEKLKNGPQVIFRSIECVLRSHDINEKREQADVNIDVDISAKFWSFFKQRELIDLGEQAVIERLDELKEFFKLV